MSGFLDHHGQRTQAKAALESFLSIVDGSGTSDGWHFGDALKPMTQKQWEKVWCYNNVVYFSLRATVSASYRLLLSSAKREFPSKANLDVIAAALSEPVDSIEYVPVRKAQVSYAVTAKPARLMAEALLRYLNLAETCGPVHGVCARCG